MKNLTPFNWGQLLVFAIVLVTFIAVLVNDWRDDGRD